MKPNPCILLLAISLLLSAGCGKPDGTFPGPDGGRIYIVGHGGSGFSDQAEFPPNSWPSATRAVEYYNADGVEVDVQMSRDRIPFMFHDQNLESASSCSGCVYAYNAADLGRCRFKSFSGAAGGRLSRVEDLIARFAARKIKPLVFLDLKVPGDCFRTKEERRAYGYAVLGALDTIIKKYAARDWVILQCASRRWLAYSRSRFPDMRLMLDYIEVKEDIDYAAEQNLYGVAGSSQALSPEEVQYAHEKGLHVQLYGVKLQGDIADALDKSPDYFLADNILLVQRMVD